MFCLIACLLKRINIKKYMTIGKLFFKFALKPEKPGLSISVRPITE